MKKIIFITISVLLFQSCISMYKNNEGAWRPKHPKFKLKKIITENNTGLNSIYMEENTERHCWFRFLPSGQVFYSCLNDNYNDTVNCFIGYYMLNNNTITIEIIYNTEGYFYTTIKGTIINNKINFNDFLKRSIATDFNDTFIKIDTILQPIEPDW